MRTRGSVWLLMAVTLMTGGCTKKQAPSPAKDATPTACLHLAAQKGDLAQVQSLLAAGCDVDTGDKDGGTPLYTAASSGQTAIVEFLISRDADVNARNSYGGTPLDGAAWAGHAGTAAQLIAGGADVNAGKETGRTPLYKAGHPLGGQGQIDVVRLLLDSGAQVLPGDTRENERLLHFAVEHGFRDLVEQLLTGGANANAVDGLGTGRSVLTEAVLRGDKEVAGLLLTHGADVNKRDALGTTPLQYARRSNKDVVELLLA